MTKIITNPWLVTVDGRIVGEHATKAAAQLAAKRHTVRKPITPGAGRIRVEYEYADGTVRDVDADCPEPTTTGRSAF